jgi:MFS family permease
MAVAPISGILSDRMDSRYLSAAGMAVMAVGMGLLSGLKVNTPETVILGELLVVGLGIGLFQTPNNSCIMGSVPRSKSGIASGMLAMMRNIGMVLGVAFSGAIFTSTNHWLQIALRTRGLSGIELTQTAFTQALHITYLVGAIFAILATFTSLIKGSTKN